MPSQISRYYARIGRRGGKASTPAKRAAARLNALKRWGHRTEDPVIPLEVLRDAQWYCGVGRNAPVGLWDARARCFWTIAVNDFADPARFPGESVRQVRLKREDYSDTRTGSFKPLAAIEI